MAAQGAAEPRVAAALLRGGTGIVAALLIQRLTVVSMTRILLVRHGHVEGIDPARFRGRCDVPLSAQGERQAHAVADLIAAHWNPSLVYTSPLQRCVQTGRPIAAARGIGAEVLAELNDLDYGAWHWQTDAEVNARWPELLHCWRATPHLVRFPQGESLQDLGARVADALRLVLQRHADDTVVLVTHDSGTRVLLLQLLGLALCAYWRLSPDPCGLSEVEIHSGSVKVLRINETQHLRTRS